jgi:hypothetical protein
MNGQKTIRIAEPNVRDINALKRFTLNVNIKRFTTDAAGQVLADGAIPAAEKKPFPFNMFGQFDMSGAYSIADSIVAPMHNTKLFTVYVAGIGTPLFFFAGGIATINAQIKKGDVVFVYADDLEAPNYFTFVIITSIIGGYASLVSQSNISQIDGKGYWGVFKIFDVKYTWYNDAQLAYPLLLINSKFNSAVKYDAIDPSGYFDPEQKSNLLTARIPLEVVLNQYIGISGFLAYENPLLNLSFELYV